MAKKTYDIPKKVEEPIRDEKTTAERIGDLALLYRLEKTDQEILRLVIGYPGIKNKQIAAALQISEQQVIYRLKKPAIQKAIADYNLPTAQLVDDMTRKATRRLMELMDSSDMKLRARACEIALKHLNQYHLHISRKVEEAEQAPGAEPPMVEVFANTVRDDGELIKRVVQLQLSEWRQVQSGEKTMDEIKRERGLLTPKDIEIMEAMKNEKPVMETIDVDAQRSSDREAGAEASDPEPVGS